MTRHQMKQLLLASACLSGVAVAVAGCSSYTPPAERQKDMRASVGMNGGASTNNSDTEYSYGSATSTVVMPAAVVAPAPTPTVVVPATTTTATVVVPATTTPPGTTVLVPTTSVPASVIVGSDADFMSSAAQFNATEIQLSQVAYQRAQSAAVRQFAAATIDAHRHMAGELDSEARSRNLIIPFSPSPAGSTAVARLQNMSGWDVDHYYLDQVIADHQAASALYGAESNGAADVTLRSTAGGDSVDIRNRIDTAEQLRTQLD